MNVDTGITSEVLTIKSETKLIDIFNRIIDKKSEAVFDYIESLNFDENTKIIVIGTYFTGVGIVKRLSEKYKTYYSLTFILILKSCFTLIWAAIL